MHLEEEFREYLKIRKAIPLWQDIVPYDWVEPAEWPVQYFAYSQMLSEHSRELANVINEFGRHITCLEAWSARLAQIDRIQDKYELILEFVEPIATIAIGLPYVIRSRFIYSTAHLCHQANRSILNEWRDDFPIDSEVYFLQADQYGSGWRSYCKLKVKIEKIGNKKFSEDTLDFRNAYNHRYSPKIEIGLSNIVKRMVKDDGSVMYRFGETKPLELNKIVPLLKDQHAKSVDSFSKYKKLIEQQISKILQKA